jgi:antitoxin component of RelBE/YafQ-DinJ toxin-antitoxin module
MNTRVSAYISDETKAEVDAFVKRYGITKARLIEEAFQHHLQSLREIPSDLVVPSRLVVTEDSMKRVAARLASDEQPTPALRELMGNAEK